MGRAQRRDAAKAGEKSFRQGVAGVGADDHQLLPSGRRFAQPACNGGMKGRPQAMAVAAPRR